MTPYQVLAALEAGLRATWSLAIDLAEDPETSIRPEYLKSIAVAQALKAAAPTALVRLEQPTGRVLGASLALASRPKGYGRLISRPGEVDIVLSVHRGAGWNAPVVLVENKRYAVGFSTISADVTRCLQFLDAQGTSGSLSVTAVTYLWRQLSGLTTAHQTANADRALDCIRSATASRAAALGIAHAHHRFRIDGSTYATLADAMAPDDDGRPAHVASPPWTLYGCVELFSGSAAAPLLSALASAIVAVDPGDDTLR